MKLADWRIEDDVGTGGHGELTVENGSSEDATVKLCCDIASGHPLRWFFVQAHTSAFIKRIPQGSYKVVFAKGLNWMKPIFSWHPSYSEFEKTFEFSEPKGIQYKSITVTLQSVPLGNVRTREITREEFLKGTERSLQPEKLLGSREDQ